MTQKSKQTSAVKIAIIVLIAILPRQSLQGQTLNKPKLDSLFRILDFNNKAMGSITLLKNNVPIYQNAIGHRAIEEGVALKNTTETKFRIGSITKMFTATLIFQLIEERKLSLKTAIKDFFPGIKNAERITISQLLNHRSGIGNFTDDPGYKKWMTTAKSPAEMLKVIENASVEFEPGTKASYSNSNYILLGLLLEKIERKQYSDILFERITSKCGLNNTYSGNPSAIEKHESHSYRYEQGWVKEMDTDLSIPLGAGSIVATTGDLTHFITALFSGKLVNMESLDSMKTTVDDFGMGMFEYPFDEKRTFGHDGAIDEFKSILLYFPEDSLAVAYCSNGSNFAMNDILIGALSIYFNQAYELPSFTSVKLTSEQLNLYTGTYANSQLPMKITISKKGDILFAQAEGQSSFPLDATAIDEFRYDNAGVVLLFNRTLNQMTLKQGGGNYVFVKE